jgi:hypothetical protein
MVTKERAVPATLSIKLTNQNELTALAIASGGKRVEN